MDTDFLAYVGADAERWMCEFCKVARDHGIDFDQEWILDWFANAIEQGRQAGRREAVIFEEITAS